MVEQNTVASETTAAEAVVEQTGAVPAAAGVPAVEKEAAEKKRTEEKPDENKSAEKQPTEGKPDANKSAEKKPTEEKPDANKSAEKQPTEEKPDENKSAEKQPTEEKPDANKSAEKKPTKKKPDIEISAGAALIFVLVVVSIITSFVIFNILTRNLEIIPASTKTPATASEKGAAAREGAGWIVTGRVVQGAAPMEGMSVWCVGYDGSGKSFTPTLQNTDAKGEFKCEAIPEKLAGGDVVKEIRITAGHSNWLRYFTSPTTAALSVAPGGEAVKLSQLDATGWLLLPPVCFFLTFLVVAGASSDGGSSRSAYYRGSLLLSLVLTVSTVWFIADAINTFNTSVPRKQVRTLGFLTIFEGTYVENSGTEWLVSLTYPSDYLSSRVADSASSPVADGASSPAADRTSSPAADRASATAAKIVHGLGAPFWVIFLSVLGAGLLTLILVIQAISNPPEFASLSRTAYGDRMRTILEHQFFVLFAPLSGIFVFQLLVLAGAAKEPVTVATIILGAGATLNGLLSKAVKAAQQYLQGTSSPNAADA